jgi:hypothetical protein
MDIAGRKHSCQGVEGISYQELHALNEPLFARRCCGRNRDNFMPSFCVILPQNSLQVFFREK